MNIYDRKSNWKVILAVIGLLILVITLLYSSYLASNLKKTEEKNKNLYIQAIDFIASNTDLDADISTQQEIQSNFALPIIHEDEQGNLEGSNWGKNKDGNQVFLRKKVESFIKLGQGPIENVYSGGRIYIFNSPLVRLIQYYPVVQILLVGLFIALGYYLFNIARRAEQNQVWAGMAKETAHQLGTPISAIIAWIEHLKESSQNSPDNLEIINELRRDVNRLELIADRFSKIGSAPALEKTNLIVKLEKCIFYMERRAPRKVNFSLKYDTDILFEVMINQHLFDWVVENVYRNALDAMGGIGEISTSVYFEDSQVSINISDSGKGIASSKFKTIFQPGYSTKQRGWGLGLSLTKRIVENYHNGKIFVKNSKINEGTTITIKLPKA